MTTNGGITWKIPSGCKHFTGQNLNKYQVGIYNRAKEFVTNWGCAIDVGAHVGIFSARMVRDFDDVQSFEPVKDNFECLVANVPETAAHNVALLHSNVSYALENPSPKNSGAWEIKPGNDFLSSYLDMYKFENVGLIKLDVQGCEDEVIAGGIKTIVEWGPVLIVENPSEDLAKNLDEIKYEKVCTINKDSVYVRFG